MPTLNLISQSVQRVTEISCTEFFVRQNYLTRLILIQSASIHHRTGIISSNIPELSKHESPINHSLWQHRVLKALGNNDGRRIPTGCLDRGHTMTAKLGFEFNVSL